MITLSPEFEKEYAAFLALHNVADIRNVVENEQQLRDYMQATRKSLSGAGVELGAAVGRLGDSFFKLLNRHGR